MTETQTQTKTPAARSARALLGIQSCSEFAAFGSGEMAVRLLPEVAGADGWAEVTGEQIDDLLACGLIRLVEEDEVWVTDAGLALLCERGWFDREARRPTEQGRYWLKRLAAAIRRAAAGGFAFASIAEAVGVSERAVRLLHYADRRRKKRGSGRLPKGDAGTDVDALLRVLEQERPTGGESTR